MRSFLVVFCALALVSLSSWINESALAQNLSENESLAIPPDLIVPTIPDTYRSYDHVPHIVVHSPAEGSTSFMKCQEELERSYRMLVRRGVDSILEVIPCSPRITTGYSASIYFLN